MPGWKGKHEQAEAIRRSILSVKKVPWVVWDEATLKQLEAKAFDPKSSSSKAQKSLYDYALWHQQAHLLRRLEEANNVPARAFLSATAAERRSHRKTVVDRYLANYTQTNARQVLLDCDAYGVDFRSPVDATPLMLAALAGNLQLVNDLLERGANPEAVDHYGHTAIMLALSRAFSDAAYAAETFGPIYERVAPTSLDVQVEGRLIKIDTHMGEFFILMAMLTGLKTLFSSIADEPNPYRRRRGFFVDHLTRNLNFMPESVVREERRKRSYFNHVLARAEVESSYRPARKLWQRVTTGYYLPNPQMKLRVRARDGDEWKPLAEALNFVRLGLSSMPPEPTHD